MGSKARDSKSMINKVFVTTLWLFLTSERREIKKFVLIIMIELKIALKSFVFGLHINKQTRSPITKFGCPISIENLAGKDEKKIRVKNKNQLNFFLKNVFVRR